MHIYIFEYFQLRPGDSLLCRFMIHQMPQATYSALSLSLLRLHGMSAGGPEVRRRERVAERESSCKGEASYNSPLKGGKASDDQLFQDIGTLLWRLGVCGMAGGAWKHIKNI